VTSARLKDEEIALWADLGYRFRSSIRRDNHDEIERERRKRINTIASGWVGGIMFTVDGANCVESLIYSAAALFCSRVFSCFL
jgi:hypothetical protein